MHTDERTAAALLAETDGPIDAERARRLASGLFVGGYEGTALPSSMAERLAHGLAGVILFRRNLPRSAAGGMDLASLVAQTGGAYDAADGDPRQPGPPLVCVDQEGGRVVRLTAPFTTIPTMRDVAAAGDLSWTRRVGAQLGRECLAAGFNVDFAPILDVDSNPANPIIGDRAFGPDTRTVIDHGRALLEGLESAGVRGCGKHYPGHGDTDLDSHLALPTVHAPRERLDAVELAPFRALGPTLSMVMTAHVVFPAYDPAVPATLSATLLGEVLRKGCGFDGVVVSDDLEMQAVAALFDIEELTVRGLRAGVDLFLVCRDESKLDRAIDAVATSIARPGRDRARAVDALTRVERLRAGLVRPRPSEAGIASVLADVDDAVLRGYAPVGTLRSAAGAPGRDPTEDQNNV
jgi:beta-N-acetylhexosaminidase